MLSFPFSIFWMFCDGCRLAFSMPLVLIAARAQRENRIIQRIDLRPSMG